MKYDSVLLGINYDLYNNYTGYGPLLNYAVIQRT